MLVVTVVLMIQGPELFHTAANVSMATIIAIPQPCKLLVFSWQRIHVHRTTFFFNHIKFLQADASSYESELDIDITIIWLSCFSS